jgi:hypothetical protein
LPDINFIDGEILNLIRISGGNFYRFFLLGWCSAGKAKCKKYYECGKYYLFYAFHKLKFI